MRAILFRVFTDDKCQNFSYEKKIFIELTGGENLPIVAAMEKVSRASKATEAQKEFLIDYLENNVDLANDK